MDLQASFVAECGIASAWPASSSLNSLVKQVECDLTFHPPHFFPFFFPLPSSSSCIGLVLAAGPGSAVTGGFAQGNAAVSLHGGAAHGDGDPP